MSALKKHLDQMKEEILGVLEARRVDGSEDRAGEDEEGGGVGLSAGNMLFGSIFGASGLLFFLMSRSGAFDCILTRISPFFDHPSSNFFYFTLSGKRGIHW